MRSRSSRIKIVLFTSSFPFGKGETFLETEIKYLAKNYTEVIIVPAATKGRPRQLNLNNVTIDLAWSKVLEGNKLSYAKALIDVTFWRNVTSNIKFDLRLLHYVASSIKFEYWLEKFKVNYDLSDCLFYTYWFNSVTTSLALVKQTYPTIRFVSRIHRADLYEHRIGIPEFPLRRYALEKIDFVYSISLDGIRHLESKYGKNKNIVLGRLGTDSVNTRTSASEGPLLHIVSCSYLVPVKRIDLIVDALAYFEQTGFQISWTHIGGGPLLKTLKLHAEQNLSNNVYEFKGDFTNSEVIEFYKTSKIDLFINVSESEGIPVSIMEAQSFAIPVIATDVGGVSEIVNNENGLLITKDISPKKLYQTLKEVYADKDTWSDKKEISKNNWNDNYSANVNYTLFTEMLNQME
jgi:glycosyltransferase involved in cell wall biosynthesis